MKRDQKKDNKSFGVKKETKEANIQLQSYGISMKTLIEQNITSEINLYPPLRQNIRQYVPFSEDGASQELQSIAFEVVKFTRAQKKSDFKVLFEKAKVQPNLQQLKNQYIQELVNGYFKEEFPDELRYKELKKKKLKIRKTELNSTILKKKKRKEEENIQFQNLAKNGNDNNEQHSDADQKLKQEHELSMQSEESYQGSVFGEESDGIESEDGGGQEVI